MGESLHPVRGEVAAETAAGVQKAMRGSPGHSYRQMLMRSQECGQLPNTTLKKLRGAWVSSAKDLQAFHPKRTVLSPVSKEIECGQTLIETILFLTLNHFSDEIFPGKETGAGERRKKSRRGRESARQLFTESQPASST